MSILNSILEINDFASLPSVASKLLQILDKDDVPQDEIVRLIQSDPSLSIKVLRIANSPIYGSRFDITSVSQAVMLIGFKKLSNLVLSVSIFSKFWLASRKDAIPIMNKFWWHSTTTAVLTQKIVSRANTRFRDNEFLGGLLHQIGTLGLIQYDFNKYKTTFDLVLNNKMTNIEAENEVFGISHIEIGHRIAQNWMLPEEITNVIANYSTPSLEQNNAGLIAAVGLADILSELNGADFYLGLPDKDPTQFEAWHVLQSLYRDVIHNGDLLTSLDMEEQLKKSSEILSSMK